MSSHSWLRTDMSANRWQQTYFKNFVDISGDLYIRKGGISAGDNADKFTVDSNGDISANSVNIAGNNSVVSGVQIQDDTDAIYVKSNDKNRLVLGDKVEGGANNNTIVVHNGNVGIGGVWAPGYKLDVSGTVNMNGMLTGDNGTYFPIRHKDFTSYSQLLFRSDGDVYLGGKQLRFCIGNPGDNTKVKMMIDGSGNVGIGTGTNSPGAKLDVDGDIHATSLDINSSAFNVSSGGVVNAASVSATTLSGTLNTAAQPNITSVGTLGSLDVTNAVNAATLSATTLSGTLNTAAQPNITSVGTLSSLNVNGNVGIGTTNPSYKLDVGGDVQIDGSLFLKGTWIQSTNINGGDITLSPRTASHNVIVAQGNVGIGTTTPSKKLDVVGDISFSGNLYQNGSLFSGGSSQWTTAGSDIYYNTGNVGIGTTSPGHKLDVAGNIKISSGGEISIDSGNSFEYFTASASNAVFQGNNNTQLRANNGSVLFYANSSGNNIERMRITNGGNVGIGTTDPKAKLHIEYKGTSIGDFTGLRIANEATNQHGTARPAYEFIVSDLGASTGLGASKFSIRYRGTNDETDPYYDRLIIDNAGKVGIGTTSPSAKLHIQGTQGTQPQLILVGGTNQNATIRTYSGHSDSSPGTNIYQEIDFAHFAASGNQDNNQINFKVSNGVNAPTTRMTINGHGHVGIGTTTPDYDLTIISNNTDIFTNGSNYYLSYQGIGGGSGSVSVYASVYADDSYVTNGHFFAYSDRRIKTNITDIDDDIALQQLRLIQPKTYEYIDKIHRTNQTVFGFIAQEVGEVMTNAMSTVKGIIPNIFESANVSQSDNHDYNIITLTNFDTADLDASSNIIEVIGSNNTKHTVTITEVIDNKTIRVDTDLSEWMGMVDASNETVIANEVQTYSQVILDASNNVVLENYDIEPIASMDASDNVVGKMADLTGDNTIDSSGNYVDASGNTIAAINADGHYIDASGNYFDTDGNFKDASGSLIGTYKAEWKNIIINGTSIFVYGQKIDDLCTLNKDAIFTVATAALQEVDRQLQAEKAKTAALESQMADLLARVTALESA